MIPGFADHLATVDGVNIAYSRGGDGPALLMLHGFPQNRALWARVAPALAQNYTVICADLRGYGGSDKPAAGYSFRDMGADQLGLMAQLGFDQFHLVGHDRGARTAHRMALDAPKRVKSLTLMDIVPTQHLLTTLTPQVAACYYHWFFLAQPFPLPEQMIGADPERYFESCVGSWGASALDAFDPNQLAAYRASWRDPDTIRGMCADYRATLTQDLALDTADLAKQVTCPALVLFGADGAMAQHYDIPATWADRLSDMQAKAIPGGHFFIDQNPDETTAVLQEFLTSLQ
ncbi:haloacetate dehalogenase H-1 [Actibacterium atlanticum]|uniref:Haloacetate dehalogenase H-1 n=1 Tax=Actibacterium atlanticum TaxID=1461693 RepID=A0A058ZQ42_9RHOB|nr:alpha/beta hydrolase [Actibacterium atlanticum]KCV83360.1 haloacetate dehalogenase H-1 [Actibacterium atlanticum]